MSYFYRNARDPVSSFTHYIGMCLAMTGCMIMMFKGIQINAAIPKLICCIIFGISLVALYAASTLYHFYKGSDKVLLRLRKLDHSFIYVLIAGTYTPIVIHCMPTGRAAVFLSVMWGFAAAGIIFKLFCMNAPRWLYTSIYLLMGWSVMLDFNAFGTLEAGCLRLVAAGGIAYSIGAAFYIAKRPKMINGIGFHEIFHIFIMIGSLFHYMAVFRYVLC